jgi:hypothetical protein
VAIVAQECPVEIAVITWDARNRPALPMPSPSYVTEHEVGNQNDGADEDKHKRFVHNGGGASGVSFHFVVGPTKAIQLIYLNENAWHASDYYTGVGNRDSIAIEHIQIGDFNRTLNHSAWLNAEIFRNPQRFAYRPDVPVMDDLHPGLALERMRQHNYWAPDKKNCPQFMRTRGLWIPFINAVAAELGKSAPATYTKARFPVWWNDETINEPIDREHSRTHLYYSRMTYTAIKDKVYCRAWASNDAPETRTPLVKGETFEGIYRFKASGVWWIMSKYGSRIRASHCSPWVSIKEV